MVLLKTQAGWLSSRWIVTINQRAQGDYAVSYSYGSGMLDTICDAEHGRAFIDQCRIQLPGT